MLLERGEERDERRGGESKEGEGREGGGRREEEEDSLELIVSRVLECIEVETVTCALLYTTVLHYMGILTGNKARLAPIS